MDIFAGDSGLVDLALSWASSIAGGIWYLYKCSRCSSPWYLATMIALSALSATYYLTRRLAHNTKRYQRLVSSLLVGGLSVFAYRSVGRGTCHEGHCCGAVSETTFLTPSGVEIPLNSFNKDRPEGWIPTIEDKEAVDPQKACHHHAISNVKGNKYGFTADLTLKGRECNVYGRDVPELKLVVEHQAKDRLHVEILPRYLGPQNESWFLLNEELIPKPKVDADYDGDERDLDFELYQGSDFGFSVKRRDSDETLFTTSDSKLIFEDQFFEIKTVMPKNYNVYGLGEVMSRFRLGNNITSTSLTPSVERETC